MAKKKEKTMDFGGLTSPTTEIEKTTTPPDNKPVKKTKAKTQKKATPTGKKKNLQLRLTDEMILEIDKHRDKNKTTIIPESRHAWIVEAIKEKLQRG